MKFPTEAAERVARILAENGPSTASALADELGTSTTAVRRPLAALHEAGLVEASERAPYGPDPGPRRGRPSRVFSLTGAGRAACEQAYDALALEALRFLAERDGRAAVAEFAAASRVPVINGGDGANEHPSQALLDLYTIRSELAGRSRGLDGLRIAMVGDLRYGRTVHSLSKLLSLFTGLQISLVSPEALRMPAEVVDELRSAGHQVLETEALEAGIADVDIVYSTRIQEERFASREEADLYRGRFRLNQSVYTANCEPNTVIMHPLPRDSREGARELDVDLNDNPNLAIFRQSDNGVVVRMALFALILDVADQVEKHAGPVNWFTERRF